ncbi:MAG: nuclease A inhibitor family protein [bacterium]
MNRWFLVLFVFALACSDEATEPAINEELVEGAAPEIGPADAPTISFQSFDGFVPSDAVAKKAQRRLISSAASFQSIFGTEAPGWANFDQNWMVYYSVGVPDAPGGLAKIDRIQLSSTGKSLQVVTKEVALDACADGVPTAAAWTLVQFPKPNLRPQSVRYYANPSDLACQTSCENVAVDLENTARGVWFTSESDYPFDPVLVAGAGDILADDAALAEALGATGPIQAVDASEWFARYTVVSPDDDPYYVEQARNIGRIQRSIEAQLTDVRVLRVGEVQVHIFVVGRTSCGDVAGVHTISIET